MIGDRNKSLSKTTNEEGHLAVNANAEVTTGNKSLTGSERETAVPCVADLEWLLAASGQQVRIARDVAPWHAAIDAVRHDPVTDVCPCETFVLLPGELLCFELVRGSQLGEGVRC